MKNFILFVVTLSLTSTSFAQALCPLTNVRLADLRTSASRLAKTITLSPECKAYQDTVNQANSNLKDVANKIVDSESSSLDPNGNPDLKATAAQAIGQLDTISSLFKDQRCGGEILGFLDYASVFVDVVTNMTPFLALYGGEEAMPWVLGSAIGGAAAKSLILFFQNKNVNMRNPDQSNNFLKNSCSFYNLNKIKTSMDELELRQAPSIVNDLKLTKEKLKEHMKVAPKEPVSDITISIKQSEKDLAKIKALQEQIKVDAVEVCSYIKTYALKEDQQDDLDSLIDRTWNNYEASVENKSFQLEMERKYYHQELNPQVIAKPENPQCSRWLNKTQSMIDIGLQSMKKRSEEVSDIKTYNAWLAQKKALEDDIVLQEAKLKFFSELTGSGFNIEYSEIIRSHQQVQDSLFESYRWLKTLKMKGLAEAWLKVKYEDADRELESFKDRYVEVDKQLEKLEKILKAKLTSENVSKFNQDYVAKENIEHRDINPHTMTETCNQLRRTWASWYNGLIHAKAGLDFCQTFDKVINKLDYPDVQTMCFGTTNKKNTKKMKSLKNKVAEFENFKPEADKVIKKMRTLSCKDSEPMSTELINLAF